MRLCSTYAATTGLSRVPASRGSRWGSLGEAKANALVQNLPRGYLPMDTRPSSAVVDERTNQLAQIVVPRAADWHRFPAAQVWWPQRLSFWPQHLARDAGNRLGVHQLDALAHT